MTPEQIMQKAVFMARQVMGEMESEQDKKIKEMEKKLDALQLRRIKEVRQTLAVQPFTVDPAKAGTLSEVLANGQSSGGTDILMEGAQKVQFRDSGTSINSSVAGQLDISGNVAVDGTLTTTGTVNGRDVAADGTKLDGIEALADVTDVTNVTAAGALMDSEVTNLAQVKGFDAADYATSTQGTAADAALPKAGGAMTGAITTSSTFDGRDVSVDGTKLDGIEALADVTDVTNVTAAGAAMLTGAVFTGDVTATDFIGPLNGAVQFSAKNTSGGTITKGQAIAISGISGNTPTVALADADAATMPAFGLAATSAADNNTLEIVTFGSLKGIQTDYAGWAVGQPIYVSTTAGTLTNVAPTGEAAKIQNIGTVERVHSSNGTIKVGGAGRSNATPNLDDGNVFIGNASNQSAARALVVADTTGLQADLDGKVGNSEVDANIKTLVLPASTTISAFGATLVDDATAAAARTTLDVDQAGTVNPPEGTAVVSTGETVGKVLQADGDNTCSWVTVPGGSGALSAVLAVGNTTGGTDLTISTGDDLTTLTAGSNNLRLGANAGSSIASGGDSNTLVGTSAGAAITTGDGNTAYGYISLSASTAASLNTAYGAYSMTGSATGGLNVAVGSYSLTATTSGGSNTGVGHNSLGANTSGSSNSAFGTSSLAANTTGINNTAIGAGAMDVSVSGSYNTSVGHDSLGALTGGGFNTVVGRAAGWTITTGAQNTIIGYNADVPTAGTSNAVIIGMSVVGTGSYTTLGNGTSDIRAAHGSTTWSTVSDERYKKDITSASAGLDFVNALRPVTWNYRTLGELPETFNAYEEGSKEVFKNTQTNHGFIAQEVKAAIDADSGLKDGFRMWDDREDGSQEVAEAALIPVLVKAIQELTARLAILEGK